jgi:hypothetical protein
MQTIDLSVPHREGGYDPESPRVSITPLAPGLSRLRTPRQPIRIGHVIDVRDPEAVIFTDGLVIPPAEASFLNCECPDCDSELAVLPYQEPGVTWLVIEHSPTCPALARWTGGRP